MSDFDFLRRSRWISLALAISLGVSSVPGCAPTPDDNQAEAPDAFFDEIANVNQSAVKRQTIGNCWIYATVGWAESLHKARTNQEVNLSESYVTFWDWFEKITSGSGVSERTETQGNRTVTTRTIQTGGSWQLAVGIIKRRGLMREADFIPEEATSESSARQSAAQTAINAALADGGELATREARRDGAVVLRVLTRAWGLNPTVSAMITQVFGTKGEKRFDGSSNRASHLRTPIVRALDLSIRTVSRDRTTGAVRQAEGNLSEVMPGGRLGWTAVDYPGTWNTSGRPEAMRRMLRALNQNQPVVVSWLVDFNALDANGAFKMEQLQSAGRPGRQGGHLTVLHDYQVRLADGRVLSVGQNASMQDREAALNGTVEFLRVKNSWGVSRSDRASVAGYYDLFLNYLHGPINWVNESNPTGPTTPYAPLNEMVIPQGF
jgi:hypothetical protein